jgi:hypothetical protein
MTTVWLVLVGCVLLALLVACAAPNPPAGPTPTPRGARATVIDLSAPFTASESSALRGRAAYLTLADLGRLDVGCEVEILGTSDRAARVKLISCPADTTTSVERRASIGAQGWIIKTALDPQP